MRYWIQNTDIFKQLKLLTTFQGQRGLDQHLYICSTSLYHVFDNGHMTTVTVCLSRTVTEIEPLIMTLTQ